MSQLTPPFTYIDDDGIAYEYDSLELLESDVEFASDFDNPYHCTDSEGHRVRLIVWGMKALLAQPVPQEFTRQGITVRAAKNVDREALIEIFADQPLRTLVRKASSEWTPVLPESLDTEEFATSSQNVAPEEFDKIWMEATTRKKGKN